MNTFPFDEKKIIQYCKQNDAIMVGVFGSIARGEATEESDIDLLIRFSKKKSLLSLVKIEREIAHLINRKIDLITEAAISPYLQETIMKDLQVIYEA